MKFAARTFGTLLLLLTIFADIACYGQKEGRLFRDSTDNAFDISNFLIRKEGFLPVPTLITEPALGFGGALGVLFFHSSFAEQHATPDISGIYGGGTNNGTWVIGGFHAGFWNEDRIRYIGAFFKANVNVSFYGPGLILDNGVNLNMDAWLFLQQIKFRMMNSDFFAGGRYLYLRTTNTFDIPIDIPDYNGTVIKSTLSELSVIISYDSRSNIFTPKKGFYFEIAGSYCDQWMGNENLYGRLIGGFTAFMPLDRKLNLAVRVDSRHTFGKEPFWARPIIDLRGVPVMKYQNAHVDVFETELTYHIYRRWHLLGFTGIGIAYKNMKEFDTGKSVGNIGAGFRYELARLFGLNMGMDFAWSSDDFGFYIVLGHAWLR
jgi:hypothetical protein